MNIVELEELKQEIYTLKSEGKKIVHCHGCFDLMHPGHIKYFQAAKDMGDILVVTVTQDVYVDKGPGRPVFNQDLRAFSIAALESVDYVAINKWPTAEETLRLLSPDIYVKGQEFEKLEDKTGKIQKEFEVIKEIGAELKFTHEIVFSSTELLNKHFKEQDTDKRRLSMENRDRNYIHSELTEKIIGCAYEVYNQLGYGFLEKVYENAMMIKLSRNGLAAIQQAPVNVHFDEKLIGEYLADIMVESKVIVELKAVSELSKAHEVQLVNYLKATGIKVGLLINFGEKVKIIRRVF